MGIYSWDLGFDWGAQPDPNLNGKFYLMNGFVNVNEGVAASPVNLQMGDTIRFVIYDLTSGASSTGVSNFQIVQNSVITFSSAETGQTQQSPFGVSSIAIPTGASNVNFTSTIFQVQCPSWNNTPSQQISVSSGRYLMNVTLHMEDGTTIKTFIVDPEMIVGSDG